jgi:hypothetical protein
MILLCKLVYTLCVLTLSRNKSLGAEWSIRCSAYPLFAIFFNKIEIAWQHVSSLTHARVVSKSVGKI